MRSIRQIKINRIDLVFYTIDSIIYMVDSYFLHRQNSKFVTKYVGGWSEYFPCKYSENRKKEDYRIHFYFDEHITSLEEIIKNNKHLNKHLNQHLQITMKKLFRQESLSKLGLLV